MRGARRASGHIVLRGRRHEKGETMNTSSRHCDQCGRSEDDFSFCEDRCMLQSCSECTFLLQLYGTGCGNVHVYYLCRDCYDNLIERGFVEP